MRKKTEGVMIGSGALSGFGAKSSSTAMTFEVDESLYH